MVDFEIANDGKFSKQMKPGSWLEIPIQTSNIRADVVIESKTCSTLVPEE